MVDVFFFFFTSYGILFIYFLFPILFYLFIFYFWMIRGSYLWPRINRNIGGSDCARHELLAGDINFGEEPSVARGGVTSGRRRDHITLTGLVTVHEPGRILAYPVQGRFFIHWILFVGKIFTVYQMFSFHASTAATSHYTHWPVFVSVNKYFWLSNHQGNNSQEFPVLVLLDQVGC